MTSPDSVDAKQPARQRKPSRLIVVVVVAIAVAIILIIVATLTVDSDRSDSALPSASVSPSSADPTASPSPSAPPTGGPSAEPTLDPEFGEPVAEVVGNDDEGRFGNGAVVRIADIIQFDYEGSGVGEVSGPAARIELELSNGSTEALDLGGVVVNAYYGADRIPAAPVYSDADATALTGSAAIGEDVVGSYSFSVPEDEIRSLVVTVSTGAGVPIVVFDPR